MFDITLVKEGLPTIDNPEGLDEVENASFDKPTIICLGGNNVLDKEAAYPMLRFIKARMGLVESQYNLINPNQSDIQFLSAYYNTPYKADLKKFRNDYADEKTLAGHFEDNVLQFVVSHFLPLIARDGYIDASNKIVGEKLPIPIVRKAFGNIRMVGHSFGGILTEQIGNALVKCMEDVGYTKKEIDEATKEIVVLNIGNTSEENKTVANFTQISLLHTQDQVVNSKSSKIAVMLHNLKSVGQDFKDTVVRIIAKKSNQITVLCEGINKNYLPTGESGYLTTSPNGSWLKKPEKWQNPNIPELLELENDQFAHTLKAYLTDKPVKGGFLMPLIARNFLVQSMNRAIDNNALPVEEYKPLPDIRELMRVPRQVRFKQSPPEDIGIHGVPNAVSTMIGYTQIIDNAFANKLRLYKANSANNHNPGNSR
jgi:hypothetical protein